MNILNKYIKIIQLIILILVFLVIILNGNLGKFISAKLHIYVYISTYILLIFLFFENMNIKENKSKFSKLDFVFIIPLFFVFIGYNGDISSNVKNNNKTNLSQISEQLKKEPSNEKEIISEELKQEQLLKESNGEKEIISEDLEQEELIQEPYDTSLMEFNDENFMSNLYELYDNVEENQGRKVIIEGCIFRDELMKENQFAIGKYYMSCCVICMSLTGMVCDCENPEKFENDKWYRIEGTISKTLDEYVYTGEKYEIPMLKIESYTEIEEHEQIYVY